MKAENANFDQWREDARFLCDQFSHAISRHDFYFNEVERGNKSDLKPQLERWQVLSSNLLNALVMHYNRGQRWQIDQDTMIELFKAYLSPSVFAILMLGNFESLARG